MNLTAIIVSAINTAGVIAVAAIAVIGNRRVRSDVADVHHEVTAVKDATHGATSRR